MSESILPTKQLKQRLGIIILIIHTLASPQFLIEMLKGSHTKIQGGSLTPNTTLIIHPESPAR